MTLTLKGGLVASTLAVLMAFPAASFAQDDFTIKLGGRLHVDYATGDADNADFDFNSTALRRARLKGSGQFGLSLIHI